MCISPSGRVALRELMEQAWQQVEGQARGMLKRAVERQGYIADCVASTG